MNAHVHVETPTLIAEDGLRELIQSSIQALVEERNKEEEESFHALWNEIQDEDDDDDDDNVNQDNQVVNLLSTSEFRLAEQGPELLSSSSSDSENDPTEGETKQHSNSNNNNNNNNNISTLIRNSDDATMTLYTKCLADAADAVEDVGTHAALLSTAQNASFLWVVLSVQAGRFAGGVFQRGVLIDHKTFSRYTTRKKQGGSQSNADSGGGGKAKSAGATLRRYNEAALHQEIQELLVEEWSIYLEECEHIFISCGHSSSKLLFNTSGANKKYKKKKQGAILKTDPKVFKVPFQSARPTLEEVKRICRCMATCWVVPPAEDEGEGEDQLKAPLIRRGIPSSDILPMETKRRKGVVKRVLEESYGEIMVWEVPQSGELLVGSGWRNVIKDVEEEDGGNFLYF